MASFKCFATLLTDIENCSELRECPEVKNLVTNAREALIKDLRDQAILEGKSAEKEAYFRAQLHS